MRPSSSMNPRLIDAAMQADITAGAAAQHTTVSVAVSHSNSRQAPSLQQKLGVMIR